jgi:hypothetical protein
MGPRASLSTTLFLGAVTLLIAVAIGNAMGNRVITQVTGRVSVLVPTPLPIVKNEPKENADVPVWKEEQVMSVATDPGFPDPRVTPEPEPPPTPRPTPTAVPTPSPRPTDQPTMQKYTSPPLLIPLASPSGSDEQAQGAAPGGTVSPRAAGTGRALPGASPPYPTYSPTDSFNGARP